MGNQLASQENNSSENNSINIEINQHSNSNSNLTPNPITTQSPRHIEPIIRQSFNSDRDPTAVDFFHGDLDDIYSTQSDGAMAVASIDAVPDFQENPIHLSSSYIVYERYSQRPTSSNNLPAENDPQSEPSTESPTQMTSNRSSRNCSLYSLCSWFYRC